MQDDEVLTDSEVGTHLAGITTGSISMAVV